MSDFKPRNLFLALAVILALALLAVIAWRYRPEASLPTLVKALPEGVDAPKLASWTSVARVLLNLQETATRN